MLSLRKIRVKSGYIAWFMVAAVLLLTLAPHHIHVHHEPASDFVAHHHDHQHTIDLHLLSDVNYAAHHDQAIVYELTPDGLLKPLSDHPPNWLLTAFLLVLVPIVDSRRRQRLRLEAVRVRQAYYHLTPPLRAPPRL
jgi:hypothetical protein